MCAGVQGAQICDTNANFERSCLGEIHYILFIIHVMKVTIKWLHMGKHYFDHLNIVYWKPLGKQVLLLKMSIKLHGLSGTFCFHFFIED